MNETNEIQLNHITASYLVEHMNYSVLSSQFDANKSNEMHFALPDKKYLLFFNMSL